MSLAKIDEVSITNELFEIFSLKGDNMKKYVIPKLNIEHFVNSDILTASVKEDENNGRLNLEKDSETEFGPWF